MNFENLIISAIGGQNEIVMRHLMDVGLLNATQYCAKDHDRKRMILKEKKTMVSFMNYNYFPMLPITSL